MSEPMWDIVGKLIEVGVVCRFVTTKVVGYARCNLANTCSYMSGEFYFKLLPR